MDDRHIGGIAASGRVAFPLRAGERLDESRFLRAKELSEGTPFDTDVIPSKWPGDRELSVLVLSARGLTTREIATNLFVCPQTVTYHVGNLLMKFRAANRVELVAKSYALGLLHVGSWPPSLTACVRPVR